MYTTSHGLTQGWSNAVAERITHTDLLAMVAAVYIYVKLRFTPEQRYFHNLPQRLEAFTAQHLRRSPFAAPALRGEHVVQQAVHQEFSLLQQRGFEVEILTAHRVDRNFPLAVCLAVTTSTSRKSGTRGARRYRRSSPRLDCMSTCSSLCRLFPFWSHFRSLPSRHGSLVRVSPCLRLAQQRELAMMRGDCRTPHLVSTSMLTGSCATISNIIVAPHSLDLS